MDVVCLACTNLTHSSITLLPVYSALWISYFNSILGCGWATTYKSQLVIADHNSFLLCIFCSSILSLISTTASFPFLLWSQLNWLFVALFCLPGAEMSWYWTVKPLQLCWWPFWTNTPFCCLYCKGFTPKITPKAQPDTLSVCVSSYLCLFLVVRTRFWEEKVQNSFPYLHKSAQ